MFSAIGVCCPDPNIDQHEPIKLRKIVNNVINSQGDLPPRMSSDKHEERGCGVSALQKTKITGGRKTDIAEFPWMAALKPLTDRKAICGGVLITDRHVFNLILSKHINDSNFSIPLLN